ncbi:MAG: hypothetical protein V1809_11750 [Planctomycetota bacterium]
MKPIEFQPGTAILLCAMTALVGAGAIAVGIGDRDHALWQKGLLVLLGIGIVGHAVYRTIPPARKIVLAVAGVFLIVIGLACAIPGVPGPGALFILWGLSLLGFQGLFFVVVAWVFTTIGLGGIGAFIIRWLKKITPPENGTPQEPS